MSKALSALNFAVAAVLILFNFVAVLSLPSALARFEEEPEDVYLLIFWVAICGSVAFVEMLVATALIDRLSHTRGMIFWLGTGATAVLASLSILAWSDAAVRPIVLPTILLGVSCFQIARHPKGHLE